MTYIDGAIYLIAGKEYEYRSGRFYRGNFYLEENLVEGAVQDA